MEYEKKLLEKDTKCKNDSEFKTKIKSKQRPKRKRKVTFGSSTEDMENLIVTQRVKVKNRKIECTINFKNFDRTEEKPTEKSKNIPKHIGSSSEERIVPLCLRTMCKVPIKAKTNRHRQKQDDNASSKDSRESNYCNKNKRTYPNNNEEQYKSSKRLKCKHKDLSYEDISSDESLEFFSDEKLDTLIKRTKARERRQSELNYPKPLCTSTPIREAVGDYDDILSSETDVSIHSRETLILEPKLESFSPKNLEEHEFASWEHNFETIKTESTSDVHREFLDINAHPSENHVISVDPVLARIGWGFQCKIEPESHDNQVLLNNSPKNNVISKEPPITSGEQDSEDIKSESARDINQSDFSRNNKFPYNNLEEATIAIRKQDSEDIQSDSKNNVINKFLGSETPQCISTHLTDTKCSSKSDGATCIGTGSETNKPNPLLTNPTNVTYLDDKSNPQTLISTNFLDSERDDNSISISDRPTNNKNSEMNFIDAFSTKIPDISEQPLSIPPSLDNLEGFKVNSGININQNLSDNTEGPPKNFVISELTDDQNYAKSDFGINVNQDLSGNSEDSPKNSVILEEPIVACREQNSEYITSNAKRLVNQVVLDKNLPTKSSTICEQPVIACGDRNQEDSGINVTQASLNYNAVSPTIPAISDFYSLFSESDSGDIKAFSEHKFNLVRSLVVRYLDLINAFSLNIGIFKIPARGNDHQNLEVIKIDSGIHINKHLFNNNPVSSNNSPISVEPVQASREKDSACEVPLTNNIPKKSAMSEEIVVASLEKNSENLAVASFEQNSEEPVVASLVQNYEEHSIASLDQISEVSVIASHKQNSEEPIIASFEQNYEEPAFVSLDQNSEETASLGQNSEEYAIASCEQNSEETVKASLEKESEEFDIASCHQNSKVPIEASLDQNSEKYAVASLYQNSEESVLVGREQNSGDSAITSHEQNCEEPADVNLPPNSKEPAEANPQLNSKEPAAASLETNNEELAVASLIQNYEEPATASLDQISEVPVVASHKQNSEEPTIASFEPNSDEIALVSLDQNSEESAIASLAHNFKTLSLDQNSEKSAVASIDQDFKDSAIGSREQNSEDSAITSHKQNSKEPAEANPQQNFEETTGTNPQENSEDSAIANSQQNSEEPAKANLQQDSDITTVSESNDIKVFLDNIHSSENPNISEERVIASCEPNYIYISSESESDYDKKTITSLQHHHSSRSKINRPEPLTRNTKNVTYPSNLRNTETIVTTGSTGYGYSGSHSYPSTSSTMMTLNTQYATATSSTYHIGAYSPQYQYSFEERLGNTLQIASSIQAGINQRVPADSMYGYQPYANHWCGHESHGARNPGNIMNLNTQYATATSSTYYTATYNPQYQYSSEERLANTSQIASSIQAAINNHIPAYYMYGYQPYVIHWCGHESHAARNPANMMNPENVYTPDNHLCGHQSYAATNPANMINPGNVHTPDDYQGYVYPYMDYRGSDYSCGHQSFAATNPANMIRPENVDTSADQGNGHQSYAASNPASSIYPEDEHRSRHYVPRRRNKYRGYRRNNNTPYFRHIQALPHKTHHKKGESTAPPITKPAHVKSQPNTAHSSVNRLPGQHTTTTNGNRVPPTHVKLEPNREPSHVNFLPGLVSVKTEPKVVIKKERLDSCKTNVANDNLIRCIKKEKDYLD